MKKVHHLVLLKFKPATPPASITALFQALVRLKEVIDGIEGFRGGAYSSPEGLNQGFTHGFVMTFTSAAARDGYLTHAEHERVKEQFLPGGADVIAFDFEE
jgi:hypothetical protein